MTLIVAQDELNYEEERNYTIDVRETDYPFERNCSPKFCLIRFVALTTAYLLHSLIDSFLLRFSTSTKLPLSLG